MFPTSTPTSTPVRLLAVTADPRIIDHVIRVAAAAGAEVEVVPTAAEARSKWSGARAVLVGADLAVELAANTPPHRPATVLVVVDPPPLEVVQAAVRIGADDVARLPFDDGHLVTHLAEVAEGSVQRGVVVLIRGAAGGLGASTLAAGLALTAARSGVRALLIDGAITGPGIDLLLGMEAEPGMRWPDLVDASGRINAATLDEALPHTHGVAVLSWDRRPHRDLPPASLAAVLDAGRRGYDLVVVDDAGMSGTSDLRAVLARSASATVVLVDDSARAVVTAARLISTSGAAIEPVHIVVRGGPTAVDTVTDVLGVNVVAQVPDEAGVRRAAANADIPITGRRSALHAACRSVLALVGPSSSKA